MSLFTKNTDTIIWIPSEIYLPYQGKIIKQKDYIW